MIKTCQVVKARRRGSLQIQLDSASIAQVLLQIIIVMILKITVTMMHFCFSRSSWLFFQLATRGESLPEKENPSKLQVRKNKNPKLQSCPKLAVKLFSSIRPRSDRIWHFATEWGCQIQHRKCWRWWSPKWHQAGSHYWCHGAASRISLIRRGPAIQ